MGEGFVYGDGSIDLRVHTLSVVDPKLFIPDPNLDPTSEKFPIRILTIFGTVYQKRPQYNRGH
jgi:hypothetical protein